MYYSYETLLQEDQTTSQEVYAFDRKLESWLCIPLAKHVKSDIPVATGKQPGSSMAPAVVAFEVVL